MESEKAARRGKVQKRAKKMAARGLAGSRHDAVSPSNSTSRSRCMLMSQISYLLNPYTIATCLARSTTSIDNALTFLSISHAAQGMARPFITETGAIVQNISLVRSSCTRHVLPLSSLTFTTLPFASRRPDMLVASLQPYVVGKGKDERRQRGLSHRCWMARNISALRSTALRPGVHHRWIKSICRADLGYHVSCNPFTNSNSP